MGTVLTQWPWLSAVQCRDWNTCLDAEGRQPQLRTLFLGQMPGWSSRGGCSSQQGPTSSAPPRGHLTSFNLEPVEGRGRLSCL
jgi:hypothetical protein